MRGPFRRTLRQPPKTSAMYHYKYPRRKRRPQENLDLFLIWLMLILGGGVVFTLFYLSVQHR